MTAFRHTMQHMHVTKQALLKTQCSASWPTCFKQKSAFSEIKLYSQLCELHLLYSQCAKNGQLKRSEYTQSLFQRNIRYTKTSLICLTVLMQYQTGDERIPCHSIYHNVHLHQGCLSENFPRKVFESLITNFWIFHLECFWQFSVIYLSPSSDI